MCGHCQVIEATRWLGLVEAHRRSEMRFSVKMRSNCCGKDRAFLTLPSEYEIVKELAGGMVLADCSERFYFTGQVDGFGEMG